MPFLPATQERRLISGEREREEVGREGEREGEARGKMEGQSGYSPFSLSPPSEKFPTSSCTV